MIQFIIPLEIPSQNVTEKGKSWRGRYAKTKARRHEWHGFCTWGMHQVGLPKATGHRSIKLIAYRKRCCYDIANLIGGAKACVDGMVDAGLLTDDRDSKAHISYEQFNLKDSPTGLPCTVVQVLSDTTKE